MSQAPPSPPRDAALEVAARLLSRWACSTADPEPGRLDVGIGPEDLLAAVGALCARGWGRLSAITGLDLLPVAPAGRGAARPVAATATPPTTDLEVLYHFCAGPAVLTLRVRLPREAPTVPSLDALLPYASFFERELAELFGVTVAGMSDPARLLLPDEWPEGVYPLRKDAALPPAPRGDPDTSGSAGRPAPGGEQTGD